jgi:hypothetical protein
VTVLPGSLLIAGGLTAPAARAYREAGLLAAAAPGGARPVTGGGGPGAPAAFRPGAGWAGRRGVLGRP